MFFDTFVLLGVIKIRSTHRSYPERLACFVLYFADFLTLYPVDLFS